MKASLGKEEKISALLTRNVEDVIERSHLETALRSGKKLRVKLGIDPTAPNLHLGHAVVLWKLREFQLLGHKIVLIIGDFTAMVGDPSGRSADRPHLSKAQVKSNMKTYLKQAGLILDIEAVEVRYNSEWLGELQGAKLMELLSNISIQQILEREDFAKRLAEHSSIRAHEMLYPVMQGYDSVAIKADIELGGRDQLLNLLTGRQLMERLGLQAQDILTVSLLEGLDGGKKMSKSVGNVVNITDAPYEQYGRLMSMRDEMIGHYSRIATDMRETDIADAEEHLRQGENPKVIKGALAHAIVSRYHGEKKAMAAAEKWEKMFSKKEIDVAELPVWKVKVSKLSLLDLLMSPQAAGRSSLKTKQQWIGLIEQGAIRINGEVKKSRWEMLELKGGEKLKTDKKSFFRIEL